MNRVLYCKVPKKRTVKGYLKAGFTSTKEGVWPTTYSDPECLITECQPRRRSFEDLWAIVRSEFPRCSRYRLSKALVALMKDDNVCLYPYRCRATSKIMFRANLCMGKPAGLRGFDHVPSNSEFVGEGKYSMNDIVKFSKK